MKLNPWKPLPEDWQQASDDELGRWLVASWMGAQADAAGFARGVPVPAAWAEDLIGATAELDSEVENAPLEAALRRACKGDREAAGRLLRDIVVDDAQRVETWAMAIRDAKRQAGTHKERRPEITEWIDQQLRRDPNAKSPDLWAQAPDWITDDIGERRFAARVSAARKKMARK